MTKYQTSRLSFASDIWDCGISFGMISSIAACDDARAELNHQMKQSPNSVDGGELLDITPHGTECMHKMV